MGEMSISVLFTVLKSPVFKLMGSVLFCQATFGRDVWVCDYASLHNESEFTKRGFVIIDTGSLGTFFILFNRDKYSVSFRRL